MTKYNHTPTIVVAYFKFAQVCVFFISSLPNKTSEPMSYVSWVDKIAFRHVLVRFVLSACI